jgi:hypothetical protein
MVGKGYTGPNYTPGAHGAQEIAGNGVASGNYYPSKQAAQEVASTEVAGGYYGPSKNGAQEMAGAGAIGGYYDTPKHGNGTGSPIYGQGPELAGKTVATHGSQPYGSELSSDQGIYKYVNSPHPSHAESYGNELPGRHVQAPVELDSNFSGHLGAVNASTSY